IYLKRSMVLSVDLPVQLREENRLIARTRHAAKQCIQIRKPADIVGCGCAICGQLQIGLQRTRRRVDRTWRRRTRPAAHLTGRERRVWSCEEARRIARSRHRRKVSLKAVTREEEEQFVVQ